MRYVIVDCGTVGQELARRWVEAGHEVVGTTPDPDRLPAVAAACTESMVLGPDDTEQIGRVVGAADAAVLATRPPLMYFGSAPERIREYRRSMIRVVRAAATTQGRLVLFSSIVVYGDGGEGEGPVTETTPLTTALEPAAQSFGAVERLVLQSPRAAVLRLPEAVLGHPEDIDVPTFVKVLRDALGDGLPFDARSLVHSIDYRDVAGAVEFVVAQRLTGVYNVVPDSQEHPRADAHLNRAAAAAGEPPFTFTGEITAPTRAVSSAKLRAAGFTFTYRAPFA